MFVQSEQFVLAHGGKIGDVSIYGQESNHTTWRLAMMNLAIRGIEADITWNEGGSFLQDAYPDLKADFILANPPFNDSEWGGQGLRDDKRWQIRHSTGGKLELRLDSAFRLSPCAGAALLRS